MLKLHLHVFFDELHRYVSGTFDHDLNVMLPRHLGELAQRFEFCELRFVVGIKA